MNYYVYIIIMEVNQDQQKCNIEMHYNNINIIKYIVNFIVHSP